MMMAEEHLFACTKRYEYVSSISRSIKSGNVLKVLEDAYTGILKFHLRENWGQCRNLHVGFAGYGPPKVISTHFL